MNLKPTFRVQEVDSSPRSQISAMSPLSTMTALTPISPFTFLYIPSFPQFQGFSVLAEAETKKADELKSSVIRCGCSKTKCLKLYCDCFANGKVCGEDCECKDCRNIEKFKEEREEVIQKTKVKNPGAFRVDISSNYKICHCNKSNCMKKYCECYQNGRACNSNCKCKQCKNLPTNETTESIEDPSESKSRAVSLLRKRCSVSETQAEAEEVQFPISPVVALKLFKEQLSLFELAEILDYPRVFFLGLSSPKVRRNQKFNNYGFDDENGDYNFVIGDHLAYRYEVMQLLGKGSFGQVLRCYDHKEKDYVAVKIIKNKKRFHQQAAVELKILEFISKNDPSDKHHLIHYKDSFIFRHHLCLVFEMLSSNLYEVLKLNNFQGFPLKIVRNITIQLLSGLCFMSAYKIIHCDLKPENILLLKSNKSTVKIIDFGSSCFEGEQMYSYIQSRFYRAPEIILGLRYSVSIDMWSLGCVVSELILGYPIFPGENEHEQLQCIMEILGLPPADLIEKAAKKAEFFRNNEPLIFPNSQGKLRPPGSRSIQDKLRCYDEDVISFLMSKEHLECLAWTPQDRMSPDEALKHPWISCK